MPNIEFPVESSLVLTFARAVGEQSPVVYDRHAAQTAGLPDIAAPLTFVQASAHFDPDYPLRPRPDEEWFGSGRDPGTPHAALAGVLHAEQHFEYHRPLVVGDILTWTVTEGETWSKQGRAGGNLTFHEFVTEYRDSRGALVVTARTVRVSTQTRPVSA